MIISGSVIFYLTFLPFIILNNKKWIFGETIFLRASYMFNTA